jgi:hypothetical protein
VGALIMPPVGGKPRAEPPEWVKRYRAFNETLRAKLNAEQLGNAWEPRERVALLRRVRVIVSACPTKEAILIALDEMIDGMGYGESVDLPLKGDT